MSEEKTIISIIAIQCPEGFKAFVRQGDFSLLESKPYANERRALSEVRTMFRNSLYNCKHEWNEGSERKDDNEWGGIDYIFQQDCKHCGLSQYSVSDRSIYDSYDEGHRG